MCANGHAVPCVLMRRFPRVLLMDVHTELRPRALWLQEELQVDMEEVSPTMLPSPMPPSPVQHSSLISKRHVSRM